MFINFGSDKSTNDLMDIEQLSKDDADELNKVLSYDECFSIAKSHIKKQKHKHKKQKRYILSSNNYYNLVSDLNTRLVSNLMTQLVSKGLVETAFDTQANDFVFWVKDEKKPKAN